MPNINSILNNWKTALTSLVAVLIIVPSVINSVNDIIVAWRGLPIGEKEEINSELFKRHWKKDPVHSKQLVVDGVKGKIPITIDIYENGDIFVDYGQFTQWFPYDDKGIAKNGFGLINTAHAGFFDSISQSVLHARPLPSKVTTKIDGHNVTREKELSDGSIERQVININTGRVKSIESVKSNRPVTNSSDSHSGKPVEVIKLPTSSNKNVEVYKLKANSPTLLNTNLNLPKEKRIDASRSTLESQNITVENGPSTHNPSVRQ